MIIRTLLVLLISSALTFAQGVGMALHGADVDQNGAITNGGYLHFTPVTYNPYDGSTCHDIWTNEVQQPLPTGNLKSFGTNDALIWLSLSPSMPYASTGSWNSATAYSAGEVAKYNGVAYAAITNNTNQTPPTSPSYWVPIWGLAQPIVYDVGQPGFPASATGPCGDPLPVNTNYGLNTNVYFFARGGLATDNPLYNSIQSLQGGFLGNSYTAGVWYPTGTTVCTNFDGASCLSTAPISAGLCPGGAVGCYLGGHVDIGHSVGPPASGGIDTVTNPFSGGEGLVAGMTYFDDGANCAEMFNGSAWVPYACVAGTTSTTLTCTATGSTICVHQSSGTFAITGAGDATFHSVVAPSFNSTATGTTPAVFQSSATFQVNGDGKAFFQLLCANGNPVSESCTYGLNSSGQLTAAFVISSGTISGAGGSFFVSSGGTLSSVQVNTATMVASGSVTAGTGVAGPVLNCTATGTSSCTQQASGNFQVNGDGKGFFQLLCASGNPTTEACTYGLTSSGALTVASCSGCGGGGVTSWNTRTGAVTLTAADVTAVEQDLRTSASPTFAGVAATVFNSSATGTTSALQQGSGNFQVNGDGKGFFQLLCANGNPTTEACTYGLTSSGVLTVASCSGCGGGVTSLNSMTGALSVTTSSNGITVTPAGGAVLLAMTQDLRSSAGPTFNTVTASTFFNCAATGTNPCIKQSSGTWSINGQGDFAGQSLATGANNGTTATAGAGAVINKSGSAVALQTYDSGGTCGIGTGEPAPGIACSSDRRLKMDIQSVSGGLEKIAGLRPVTFRWIGTGMPSVGFIAQEVQDVLPNLVTHAPDSDYLMLSEEGMIPYLVDAVKALKRQVETLEGMLAHPE